MRSTRLLPLALPCLMTTSLAGCLGRINVLGRGVPDSEYRATYDAQIARERQGLEPDDHDEHGRIPSWDQFWCNAGGASMTPPTAQSRRLKRYIIKARRAAGLRELTCVEVWIPDGIGPNGAAGSFRRDHYYQSGDPRIFQWPKGTN